MRGFGDYRSLHEHALVHIYTLHIHTCVCIYKYIFGNIEDMHERTGKLLIRIIKYYEYQRGCLNNSRVHSDIAGSSRVCLALERTRNVSRYTCTYILNTYWLGAGKRSFGRERSEKNHRIRWAMRRDQLWYDVWRWRGREDAGPCLESAIFLRPHAKYIPGRSDLRAPRE